MDEDFHRGEDAYNNFYGNPKYRNPNLGEVKRAPFYAFTVVLSDLGTKGGMLTDENARVLRADGSPIGGLYAVGNNSAAVMGNSYAGPGATLGPAMTFGWIAAHDIAEQARLNRPKAAAPAARQVAARAS
ncbi:FAD-binding protein [Phenylobacterium sp. J367]|uniref:FAD-binding protein n=1 Tax=Phenylobacterium sp. J367 TaxID=2898435 RepID=UPI0035B49007